MLGSDADVASFGSTKFGIDGYDGEDISDEFENDAGNLLGTDVESFGVYVNKRIAAAQTDIFAGYRLDAVDTPDDDDDVGAFMIAPG